MPVKQVTAWPTEADFEADLQAGLRRAFPWLPAASIRHQTKFSFTSGRSHIEVDGRAQSQATARADVLLYFREQPLAVLELKRSGQAVDSSDIEQGLSYARMIHPRLPPFARRLRARFTPAMRTGPPGRDLRERPQNENRLLTSQKSGPLTSQRPLSVKEM